MLGIREPEIYGDNTYEDLLNYMQGAAEALEMEVEYIQSNHEGDLVDAIQRAYFDGFDGIVINPGAYTHTSIALLDAVKAVGLPTVEVHITDPDKRETFRKRSYIRRACVATVKGLGIDGYVEAMKILNRLNVIGDQKKGEKTQ
jgi:3-dehydroquinate dehydratase-2